MQFDNGEVQVSAGSTVEAHAAGSGEINLYDELAAFVELPPENQRGEADPQVRSSPLSVEPNKSEPIVPEYVEAKTAEVVGESAFINVHAAEPGQSRSASSELPDLSRPSGPLAGLILSPEFTFTGALTRGVCLACGAESGADDLFCVTCGAFIDEVETTLQSKPACVECGQRIAADEIFCPSCGAVLPAA